MTLYILTGLPYAGKTTLTKELVSRFGFPVVSMDDIMDRDGLDSDTMTMDDWLRVYSEGYDQLKALLDEGKSVVLDLGNLKRSERETARQIAKSKGAQHKLLYLKLSKEELRHRWEKNAELKERGQLSDATLERAIGMFAEPTPDENPILLDSQTDLNKWTQENVEIDVQQENKISR